MGSIRENASEADPKEAMIRAVEEEAARSGAQLTREERNRLESPGTGRQALSLGDATDHRLRTLVASVVSKERQSGYAARPGSFVNAVRPAGEREYPYVVELAEDEIRARQPEPALARKWWAPISLASLLMVLLLVAIVWSVLKR
jgi:hypothetical protein